MTGENDKLNTFTSTGSKMFHHPEAIMSLKKRRIAMPISLQIAPTSRCNLNCVFCSNANRSKHEDLPLKTILKLLYDFKQLGLKTVEWTGGGDPTMYPEIGKAIVYADHIGLEQGFITNGVALHDLNSEILDLLKWVRVSMNCLDYVDHVHIPHIKGTLGMSYVMNSQTTPNTLSKVYAYAKAHKVGYVRIVPDCRVSDDVQIENNRKYAEMEFPSDLFFYQPKVFQHPKACYWGYFKPFVLHDGWVYPCSSVVLNSNSEGVFHERYRWVRVEELNKFYQEEIKAFPTDHCDHCVFSTQNEMIHSILNPSEMCNFV